MSLEAEAFYESAAPHRLSAVMRKGNSASSKRQKEIYDFLVTRGPRTVEQLATETQCNYHTARRAVVALQERDLVMLDRVENKARYYKARELETGRPTIPNLTVLASKTSIPANEFLKLIGNERSMSTLNSVMALPGFISDLFMLASLADQDIEIDKNLESLKAEMQMHYLQLHSNLQVWKQIITNDFWWDSETLKDITNDPRFNYEEVLEAHKIRKGDVTND